MRLVSPPTQAHVLELAERMREADREEAAVLGAPHPLDAVEAALDLSALAWAGLTDGGDLLFVAGVMDGGEGCGHVWVLSPDAASKHPVAFCRGALAALREALRRWPTLILATSQEHEGAIAFAERLGATPGPWVSAAGRRFLTSTIGRA